MTNERNDTNNESKQSASHTHVGNRNTNKFLQSYN
jgi:hypothetical protein